MKVELDLVITEDLKIEGAVREIVRAINDQRKKQGLTIGDKIKASWKSDGEVIGKVFASDALVSELKKSTLTEEFNSQENEGKEVEINGEKIKLEVVKI